jgi:hypothetical protein
MGLQKPIVVLALALISTVGLLSNRAHAQSENDCVAARKWITCANVQAQSCEQLRTYASACGIGRARQLVIATRCGVLHCVRSSR